MSHRKGGRKKVKTFLIADKSPARMNEKDDSQDKHFEKRKQVKSPSLCRPMQLLWTLQSSQCASVEK